MSLGLEFNRTAQVVVAMSDPMCELHSFNAILFANQEKSICADHGIIYIAEHSNEFFFQFLPAWDRNGLTLMPIQDYMALATSNRGKWPISSKTCEINVYFTCKTHVKYV